jgi:hypothetical protein
MEMPVEQEGAPLDARKKVISQSTLIIFFIETITPY